MKIKENYQSTMNCSFAVAVMISIISIGTVLGYQLEMLKVKIIENGKELDEKIYVDKEDNYEIFSVPAHGDLSALLLVNDFKRNHSIYKVADDRTCYVVPLDANEEKPTQLKKSVEKVHGNFPSATVTVQHKTFLTKRALDLTTEIGKMAQKFCGNYEVVEAEYRNSVVDLNKVAEEEKQRIVSRQRRVKRFAFTPFHPIPSHFRANLVCGKYKTESLNSIKECWNRIGDMQTECELRGKSCIYSITCDLESNKIGAQCTSKHTFNYAICCKYSCLWKK